LKKDRINYEFQASLTLIEMFRDEDEQNLQQCNMELETKLEELSSDSERRTVAMRIITQRLLSEIKGQRSYKSTKT